MTEMVANREITTAEAFQEAMVDLFEDWSKDPRTSINNNGHPIFLPGNTTICLVQTSRSYDRLFKDRTSEVDYVSRTIDGSSIMARREAVTTENNYPLLTLALRQLNGKKASPIAVALQKVQKLGVHTRTTMWLEVVSASGSSEKTKKWTLNPNGEVVDTNGQVVDDPGDLQEALDAINTLKPGSPENEAV